jgi:hypothetical protein
MKLLGLAGLLLLTSSCAIFSGGDKSAAYQPAAPDRTPAAVMRRAPAAEPFEAAYGVGRPVALVPCAEGAGIADDCRAANDRHQISGEREVSAEDDILTETPAVAASH